VGLNSLKKALIWLTSILTTRTTRTTTRTTTTRTTKNNKVKSKPLELGSRVKIHQIDGLQKGSIRFIQSTTEQSTVLAVNLNYIYKQK
jgi:hypothetical protein